MSNRGYSGGSLLREIRRRGLPRACLLYILACWVALQASELVFSALGLNWPLISRGILVVSFLAFPLVILFAWFFRVGSDGVHAHPPFVERRTLDNIAPVGERRRDEPPRGDRARESEDYSWLLEMETGPLAGQTFGIDTSIEIGRALECDLTLPSAQVSRRHARLSLEDGSLQIEDLGSSNGTTVNGVLIRKPVAMEHGDCIQLHDVRLRVRRNPRLAFVGQDTELHDPLSSASTATLRIHDKHGADDT